MKTNDYKNEYVWNVVEKLGEPNKKVVINPMKLEDEFKPILSQINNGVSKKYKANQDYLFNFVVFIMTMGMAAYLALMIFLPGL